LDDRSITEENYFANRRDPIKFQALMQLLTLLMHHLRRTRVNASLTIQLFSQLFHVINAYVFNQVLINTEAKPRGARQDDTSMWLTRIGATRLLRRLDRIKQWAQRQGLERAAECRLQRCVQACQLILADRSNLDEFYQFCMGLLSLNSMQLEWLMAHLVDPPPVPDDWIDLIVTGGKEVNDRAIADEMEHLMHTARDSPLMPEIQLTEPRELPLPLLLPPDGYASDTILTGAPTGLVDFLRLLESKRLIHLRRNNAEAVRIKERPWANYLRLSQVEENSKRLSDTATYERPVPTTDTAKPTNPQPTDSSESSDLSSDDDEEEEEEGNVKSGEGAKRTGHPRPGRYKPAPASGTGSLKRPIQHRSLPDLTTSEFDSMAREARVPVDSIIRFYLRKHNNSLGLSIVAAKAEGQKLYGIYVKEIVPGGAAARDGRLATGDQILAIGSSSLIGCAQSDAVATIAKQSRDDAGIHLTVARGAAKYHRILDLIRPSDGSQTVPKTAHHTSTRQSVPPVSTFADLHQTDDPVDRKKALVQKIGSPVLPPSTRVGLRPSEDSRLPHSSLGRRFGRDGGGAAGRQPGSLSRSTPSLNLAEVGMDDEPEPVESPLHRPKSGHQSKNEPANRTKSPSRPSQKVNQRTQSQPSNRRSSGHRSSSRSRSSSADSTAISSSSRSASTTSGSDIVHEPTTPPNRPVSGNRPPEQKKSQAFGRPGHRRTSPGKIQASRSHPNIASKAAPTDRSSARRVSLSNGVEPKIPVAESVSDEFSSLDSISSEQTPCSLQDSGADQPPVSAHEPDQANLGSSTGTRLNGKPTGKEKTRHPPPPPAPSQSEFHTVC
uniref:PDZ domain-containing protein n=1 Tax=Echinostoma caproni TaxID=27848 RepID=A0A183B0R4_9TREM